MVDPDFLMNLNQARRLLPEPKGYWNSADIQAQKEVALILDDLFLKLNQANHPLSPPVMVTDEVKVVSRPAPPHLSRYQSPPPPPG